MWTLLEMSTRLVVGGFLIASGVGKLSSVWTWRQVWLATYQLLPRVLVRPVALTLPCVELLAGLVVLLGGFGRAGLIGAGVVIAATTTAVGVALARGLTVTGGCLSRLEPLISRRVIVRNAVFAGAVALVAQHGVSGPAIAAFDATAQMTMVAVAAAAVITYVALSRRVQRRRLLAEFARA